MRIRLVPLGNADLLEDLQLDPKLTLNDLLRRAPALSLDPFEEKWMGLEVPELGLELPAKAIGKSWMVDAYPTLQN